MDEPVTVEVHFDADPEGLPEGMIGRAVTEDGEFLAYVPAEILIEEDEDEE